MVKVVDEPVEKRAVNVNLSGHHAQCEHNYHLCMALVPECRDGRSTWNYTVSGRQPLQIRLVVVDAAPYTTTLDVVQHHNYGIYLQPPRLRIRLYHDAGMAEVVAWNHHRHWRPNYDYPNRSMYQPDEKLVLNRFLGEWLLYCQKLGVQDDSMCEKSRINGN